MNWDALGAIAELLGAIAVFGTLIYLAIQIRQSNIVTREQAHYHMLQNQIGYFDRLSQDPDFVKTVYGADLTDEDVSFRQHEAHAVSLLFRWNWEYLRVLDGVYGITDIPLEGFRWQVQTIGIAAHWEQKKAWLDPRFVEFMDKEVIPYADDA
jgi:hypothetical protein